MTLTTPSGQKRLTEMYHIDCSEHCCRVTCSCLHNVLIYSYTITETWIPRVSSTMNHFRRYKCPHRATLVSSPASKQRRYRTNTKPLGPDVQPGDNIVLENRKDALGLLSRIRDLSQPHSATGHDDFLSCSCLQ